ncbi:MAG: YHS domain-containing protein [Thermoplasmata archaeon]
MAMDPVCGMSVDEGETKLTATHEGHTFYFCSDDCQKTFETDPHRYGGH